MDYNELLTMAADFREDGAYPPLRYLIEELGWDKQKAIAYLKPFSDIYMAGFCTRCGRIRLECHMIIDAGNHCTS